MTATSTFGVDWRVESRTLDGNIAELTDLPTPHRIGA